MYNVRFTAIRSCESNRESNPADSLFCQPMRTFGQHISIPLTTYFYILKKLYLNIKNLEKKIIYILIVALQFCKPEQNWARILLKAQNPRPGLSPLERQNHVTGMSTRCHIKILYMETTRFPVGAFLKTIASVLWKRFCLSNHFGL